MLVFDPIAHSYKNEFTGELYTSATTFLHKFKKPCEADVIAERVAKKRKCTVEEVKAEWKQANDDSKTYGTEMHAAIEMYNKTGTYDIKYVDIVQAYIDLDLIDSKRDQLLIEHQVYAHEHKLAGTADIIRLEDRGGFSIFDLKTNKKFNLYSQYNDYMLSPVEHLPACEYSIYALQLSLYAYMYQGITGRKVNQLGVIYYDRVACKFIHYPINYMKHEILTMLNYIKTK
jgi:hypothetical protein